MTKLLPETNRERGAVEDERQRRRQRVAQVADEERRRSEARLPGRAFDERGGGRLVVELNAEEVKNLGEALTGALPS